MHNSWADTAGNGSWGPARRPPKRRNTAVLALLLAACLLAAGCSKSATTSSTPAAPATAATSAATCPTSNTTAFAKTKFVLHTGLAFGTFHRYIYTPYKAGTFSKGAQGRIVAFARAAATVLFIKRELRLATADVKANPTLCKAIAAPLSMLSSAVGGAVTKLRGGDASGVTDANSQIAGIASSSSAGGAPITERTDESAG